MSEASGSYDDDIELDYLGTFSAQIVGIQYYEGTVNRHEMVILQREADNPYDRWAVRVDNVRGQRVGHLPRTLVMHIAPLMDKGMLFLEAAAPAYGLNNKFKMPVVIDAYGNEADRNQIARAISFAGCQLLYGSGSAGLPSSGASSSRAAAPPAPVAPKAQRLTSAQVAQRVNTVFDSLLAESEAKNQLEAADIVTTGLYPHQKEALAWMVELENSSRLPVFWEPQLSKNGGNVEYFHTLTNFTSKNRPEPTRGGILADDMGLGKSLTTIALIATNCPGASLEDLQPIPPSETTAEPESGEDAPPKKKARKPAQPKKPKTKAPTKAEQRAAEAQQAAARVEDPPKPPTADGPRPTLILCPLSVITGWAMQFEEHVAPGTLNVLVYHGADRDRRTKSFAAYDVVISTYGTLVAEAGTRNGLGSVNWLRVIADEAHTLKNPATQTAKAVAKLKAERRWGLTGTAIQNSLRDLHGLVSFLKMEPLDDAGLFKRTVDRPMANGEQDAVKRLQALVGSIALRRTKTTMRNGVPLVSLPPKEVYIVPVELEDAAKAKYKRWEDAGRAIIAQHLGAGTLMANYTAVLEVLLRLRQICCDPSLVKQDEPSFASLIAAGSGTQSSKLTPELTAMLVDLLREGLENECPVCLCEITVPCITLCRHIFCRRCIDAVISKDKPCCPLCRGQISHTDLVELPPPDEEEESAAAAVARGGAEGEGSSQRFGAKINALLGTLRAALNTAPEEKHIVFSQFTGMLDLVEAALLDEGLSYCRLDGKTPAKKRGAMLRAFSDGGPESPRVFLVSLKAGGVGLNLTAANHAHICDPWWNPAVEEQAADRVHRLGQTRTVQIHRYVVKGSIEERLLELQEEKRKLMRAAFERKTAEDVRAARIRDVRLLMELN